MMKVFYSDHIDIAEGLAFNVVEKDMAGNIAVRSHRYIKNPILILT
jgi:hypothetical protein